MARYYRNKYETKSDPRRRQHFDIFSQTVKEEWGGLDATDDYVHAVDDAPKTLSDAEMTVLHKKASGFTEYPPASMLEPGDDQYNSAARFAARTAIENGGQTALFRHQSQGPRSVVDTMTGTRGGRVPNMIMLSMASMDTAKEYGRELQPSDNLSKHSNRLVEHLKGAGVVDQGFQRKESNNMNFRPEALTYWVGDDKAKTAGEIGAAKTNLRGILPRNPKPQGVQLSMQFGEPNA